MNGEERPLVVVGHKNPDTDTVCSAVVYARYKQELQGTPAVAYRAGNVNEQTQYVLDRFEVDAPPLLTDVYPKVHDIMIDEKRLVTVRPADPLDTARRIILERRFSFLPVVDERGRCLGKLTALRLAELPQLIVRVAAGEELSFNLRHLAALSGGQDAADVRRGGPRAPERFAGRVLLAGFGAEEEVARAEREGPVALLVDASRGDLNPVELGAEGRGARFVIAAVGARDPAAAVAGLPEDLPALVLPGGIVESVTSICSAIPVETLTDPPGPTFAPTDLIRDIQREVNKYNEGGFLVLDENQGLRGVVTRVSFLDRARRRIVMVDHNEYSQAVDGIEHAEVVEIIDHHRIGARATDSPITFINKVVGSTATIIAEMYHDRREAPDRRMAGLLLAALLSDTVILRSPTTTVLDRALAPWLAEIAGVAVDAFGEQMFAAGGSLAARNPAEIVGRDQKFYEETGKRFTVSQIEVIGFKGFHDVRDEIRRALGSFVADSRCDFGCLMVTDITEETTLLLCAGDRRIIESITYPRVEAETFELRGVLSRKKQVVPYIVDLLRNL